MIKKGSILIELIIAISIVMIIGTIMISFISKLLLSINNRKIQETMSRDFYSVVSEIRYNNEFEKVKESLKEDDYNLKYNDGFIEQLKEIELFSLEQGDFNDDYIILSIIEQQEDIMNIKVKMKYKNKVIEEEIIKARWMDEV